mmetsp:Transcript_10233/g.22633  ORF Transcript_10233/g.22633 Transcript_10233/m.22633 type:complete len:303 (-) Transcript_10233:227-1135(-)
MDQTLDLLLCGGYIGLNAALNFANRWALGMHGFSFPVCLTAAHMLLNPMFLAPMMFIVESYRSVHREAITKSWKPLLVIAAFNGIQITLNNASLVHIELSMNQVIRATMPLVVALCDCLRGSAPALNRVPVLAAIAVGVMMVVYSSDSKGSEWLGIALVTASVSLQAAQMSFAGSLLSMKLDSFQMTFYTSPLAFLTVVGPAVVVEGSAFSIYVGNHPWVSVSILVGTCMLAVVYNLVLFQTIRRLGSVGSAVLGNVKIVVLLFMSRLLMGEMGHWTRRHFLGCLLTFGGAAVYSQMKSKKA